jgi:Glycosyl transferase family 11
MTAASFGRRVARHLAWRAGRAYTVTADALRRGDRVVVMTPAAGLRFGNWLYLWLDAHQRSAAGEPTLVLEAPGMTPWLDEFPRLRALTVSRDRMRFHDRREWDDESWTQRFGVDFTRASLDAFIDSTLVPGLDGDQGDTLVINVRRGDYFSDPNHAARYGWDIVGYLVHALAAAGSAERALVVSDDAQWCRDELDVLIRATVPLVDYAEPDPSANFRAIAGARRLIGTNSTFSYWGAYVAGARFGSPQIIMPRFHGRLPWGSDAYQLDPAWIIIEGYH